MMEAYGVLPSYGKMELKETLERGDWNVMLYGDDEKAHDWSFRVTQGGVNLFTVSRSQVNYTTCGDKSGGKLTA